MLGSIFCGRVTHVHGGDRLMGTVDSAIDSLSDSKINEITILLWPYICTVLER